MDFNKLTQRLDHLGMTASTVCAVHCALMPVIITFLPLLGLTFLSNIWIELSMLSISLIVGSVSLVTSYFKVHKNIIPLLYFLLGFAFILVGHFSQNDVIEPVLLPIGGIVFVVAHFINYKKNKAQHHH